MSLTDIPNWFYLVFLTPVGFVVQRVISFSSKITKLETKQQIYIQQYDNNVTELKERVKNIELDTKSINEKLNILIGKDSVKIND